MKGIANIIIFFLTNELYLKKLIGVSLNKINRSNVINKTKAVLFKFKYRTLFESI